MRGRFDYEKERFSMEESGSIAGFQRVEKGNPPEKIGFHWLIAHYENDYFFV